VSADAKFTILGLPQGRWRVVATVGGDASKERRAALEAETDAEIDLEVK
jgi:hypothetical protein